MSVQTPGSWSSDGQWLAYYDTDPVTGFDIWALPSGGDRKPRAVVKTPSPEAAPEAIARWSLARVYVRRIRPLRSARAVVPVPGGRTQISTSGGTEPVWSRDGRELFYLDGDAMMAVEIRTSPTFTAGTPRMLFQGRYVQSPNSVASYDVSADGQRFLRVQPMHPDPPRDQIQVTLNWFEELK